MNDLKARFAEYSKEFVDAAANSPFVVFLCGPSIKRGKKLDEAAMLRKRIKTELEKENFQVVLGEDDGIDNPTLKNIGINVQDSEIMFISKHCNAVVLIAGSVGSFCELGLFSWHLCHDDGIIDDVGFLLLIDKKYKRPPSYLNQGPAVAVNGHGHTYFVDFKNFDVREIVDKLKARRGTYTVDRRGRPTGSSL